jgi:hypothetical protein
MHEAIFFFIRTRNEECHQAHHSRSILLQARHQSHPPRPFLHSFVSVEHSGHARKCSARGVSEEEVSSRAGLFPPVSV